MIALSGLVALVIFLILSGLASSVAQVYCFNNDIAMTEFDWIAVDRWIFGLSGFFSLAAFLILFLCLLQDRIAYIRKITQGIDSLREGAQAISLPLEGNNELTELALAIHNMTAAREQLRQKEQALAEEKDRLIRSLSHDIRTPLTSILAYSEYLSAQEQPSPQEQQAYIRLIHRKAEQIRLLTDILLDGSKRNLEQFDQAELLMAQLAAEFEEELEDRFRVKADLSACRAFSGAFDLQELRRIFDNLCSNIQKYADPAHPIDLAIRLEDHRLIIRQSNAILLPRPASESHRIGLSSISRIAQHYDGRLDIQQDATTFTATITLCKF